MPQATGQANFRGIQCPAKRASVSGGDDATHRRGGAVGGCVLARESARGPPSAGIAPRRHPLPWSRAAPSPAPSASPPPCFLRVKNPTPHLPLWYFIAEAQRGQRTAEFYNCLRRFRGEKEFRSGGDYLLSVICYLKKYFPLPLRKYATLYMMQSVPFPGGSGRL